MFAVGSVTIQAFSIVLRESVLVVSYSLRGICGAYSKTICDCCVFRCRIMSKTHPPELKKFMDKEMELKLNGNRRVSGVLRGFDPFMNMVIEVRSEIFHHVRTSEGICDSSRNHSSVEFSSFSAASTQYARCLTFVMLQDAIEIQKSGDQTRLGMVVIRGNSVVIMEPKERI